MTTYAVQVTETHHRPGNGIRAHWGPAEGTCRTCTGAAPDLTEREIQILQLTTEGLTKPEIGKRLYLAPDTIRTHTTRIRTKLGAHTMAQAVAIAIRTGVIQ